MKLLKFYKHFRFLKNKFLGQVIFIIIFLLFQLKLKSRLLLQKLSALVDAFNTAKIIVYAFIIFFFEL